MSKINKYGFGDFINDDMAVFNDFFNFGRPTFTFLEGKFYDPDKYELVIKKDYREQALKNAEQRLENSKVAHQYATQRYEEEQRKLQGEIDELRKQLKP
jgi:hypothetical protein